MKGREMEQVIFLLGPCLFSWPGNALFSPFDIILTVPLKYIQPLGSICQHSVSFGKWQAGFKFRTAEYRLSIGTDHMSPVFIFKNSPYFIAECWVAAGWSK